MNKGTLRGSITAIDYLKREASFVAKNSALLAFDFHFGLFEGGIDDLFVGLEAEMIFTGRPPNRQIEKVIPNPNAKKPENLKYLQLTETVESCVTTYFSDILELVSQYELDDSHAPQLDFLRIKRFLFTAYNNLYELDHSIHTNKLDQLNNELNKIHREYQTFKRKTDYPVSLIYEKAFLAHQSNYGKLYEKIEGARHLLDGSIANERALASRLREKEKQLQSTPQKSPEYAKIERDTKHLRRLYVDILHFISVQKDTIQENSMLLKMFHDRYWRDFVDAYSPFVAKFEQLLTTLLNTKAHQLDTTLWNQAKGSRAIRQFFSDSGIMGNYSSKTFLKYYVKTLDKEKLRVENGYLMDMLAYLESMSKKNILIIRTRYDDAMRCKQLLESLDEELNISVGKEQTEILKATFHEPYDVIILEGMPMQETLKNIQKYCTNPDSRIKKTVFVLFVREFSPAAFAEAKKAGVHFFLRSGATDEEFLDLARAFL